MDTDHFDSLPRSISRLLSRRVLTATLGAGALLGIGELVEAMKQQEKKKRKKKKKKVKFNDFGCVNVGNFCKSGDQCCSGICEGSKCQAHDESTCQAGQTDLTCGVVNVDCSAPGNNDGLCNTTTGNAGYCVGDRECIACTKDADCTSICGPDAACILCPDCPDTDTACVGPVPESCFAP